MTVAKTKITNTSAGARGFYNAAGELIMVEKGQSVSHEISAAELKDLKTGGSFKIGGSADDDDDAGADAGPLDGSIGALKTHLDTVDDVAELEQLGKDEAAGKNRQGALDAIQGRIDAISAA
jgi:hypothetical protein